MEKIKQAMKRTLAMLMVVIMLICSAPLDGFVGLEWSCFDFGMSANAATEYVDGYYTYCINNQNEALIIRVDDSVSGDIIIPQTLGDCNVTAIGSYAFSGKHNIKSVVIPGCIKHLYTWSFSNCDGLKKVVMCNGVERIDDAAFSDCNNLFSVTIPHSVTIIQNLAFFDSHLKKVYYTGTREQWNKIKFGAFSGLGNKTIYYNSGVILSNTGINTKNPNQKITITPKDATGSLLDDTSSFSAFASNAFESISDVKINSNLGDSIINGSFTAKKSDIESKDIVLSRDNYYNYIIPKDVISSWSTSNGTAYKFDALMQKDKKDGKPYVSTVFGRESDKGAYKELKTNKLSVFEDKKYDIIISAGGLNGKSATYYISQDNAHRISSSNGVFDSKVLYTVLDYSKDTYAYFITSDGIVSDPIKIKIENSVPQDDYTQKLLSGSEISLVGKDGQKIKIGEDFPLVGGAEISLEAFKFPLVGIDVNGDNVKISLGIDVFSTKESDSQKRETTWLDYKKGIKTLGDKYNDSKDALQHYRNFAKTFIDKNGLKQSSFIDSKSNFNLSLLGYLEGTIINGKIVFKEALIKVEGKFTFRYTQQGAIWVIPAYVYIEGSSKVGLTGNKARQFSDTNIPLDFGLMLDIEPALKIGAGAGVKNAASLGLWGKGSLPYHNDFSEKYHNLHLKGEFGWEAEFFIVSAEGTLLEGEFKLFDSYYGKTKKSFLSFKNDCLRNSLKQNETTVSVASRDYAENTSEWLGEYPISLYSLADNGVSFNVLQTSIFGQSNPQLVSFGDKDGFTACSIIV